MRRNAAAGLPLLDLGEWVSLVKSGSRAPELHRLGGDGIVAGEGFLDLVRRDSALAADAPVIAAEFDDGGWLGAVGAASIEDERDAVAELVEDLLATFAGGRAGKIRAGAGERSAEFRDEIADDFAFGPTQRDAPSVGGDF